MKKQVYFALPLFAIVVLLSFHLFVQMDLLRECAYYPVVLISLIINMIMLIVILFYMTDIYNEMMISMQMMIKATMLVYSAIHYVVILCVANSQDVYTYLEIELLMFCILICLESSMFFLGRRKK